MDVKQGPLRADLVTAVAGTAAAGTVNPQHYLPNMLSATMCRNEDSPPLNSAELLFH